MSLSLTTEVQTKLTLTNMIQLISIDWYYCVHLSKEIMIGSCPLVNPRSVSLWLTAVSSLFLSISIRCVCMVTSVTSLISQTLRSLPTSKGALLSTSASNPEKSTLMKNLSESGSLIKGQGIWKQRPKWTRHYNESLLYKLLLYFHKILISLCPVCDDNVATRIST